MQRYALKILIAISVLINVVLGGSNNQTLSARNYEWKRKGKLNIVFLIDALIGKEHCRICWTAWKRRRSW